MFNQIHKSLVLLLFAGFSHGTFDVRADETHVETLQLLWSLRPLPDTNDVLASLNSHGGSSKLQPIDRFVLRRLQESGLTPSERAEPHRQVRRLSFMLTGLPPEPELVSRFVAAPTDENYTQLVDHYLNSPHFGERWARHWMDVVRYAETWGYEWNHLVREAWRYRDYLIRAFNQDVPYDQLIREHVAGDLLTKPRVNHALGINESLIGTAFYRFGETGHDDCLLYPAISLDVMDNQIDTLTKAFQALTVSCSRCHDHKLDDIPQRDYYRLLGIMASSRQVIRTLDLPGRQKDLKTKLNAQKDEIRKELGEIWLRDVAKITLTRMEELLTKHRSENKHSTGMEHPLFAWEKMANRPEGISWKDQWNECRQLIQAEHERRVEFNRANYVSLVDLSDQNAQANWGFEGLSLEDGVCFTSHGDFSVFPDGPNAISGILPAGFFSHSLSQRLNAVIRSPLLPDDRKYVSYKAAGQRRSVCRTIIANCTLPYFHTNRFDSNKLAWATVNLQPIRRAALGQFRSYLEWATALDDQGFPILDMPQAEYQKILDNPRSWIGVTDVVAHDVDRPPFEVLHPQVKMFELSVSDRQDLAEHYRKILRQAVIDWSANNATKGDVYWINAFIDQNLLSTDLKASARLSNLVAEYRELEQQVDPPKRIVGMSDEDDGFDVRLLAGGDATAPLDIVHRGFLAVVESQIPDVLGNNSGSGRLGMAELIAHPENPLTARVMANRIWHYLFGQGIVRSVDNFGTMGDAPTHPHLLDHLARQLINSGWSVKSLIREIVLSDTFRQSSATSPAGKEKDPENNLFHRYPSRRMEAEVIRDSVLFVSGRLDRKMFGASVNPFRAEDVDRRKLYAGPLDGDGRRSLYLKVTRMGPSKLLELFNFPDPSVTRGRRDRTNVPAQALGLMNHPFVHQQAEVSANRLLHEFQNDVPFERMLDRLFLRLLSRSPSDVERHEYSEFFQRLARTHEIESRSHAVRSIDVWKDLIHTLFNLKEFTYVL